MHRRTRRGNRLGLGLLGLVLLAGGAALVAAHERVFGHRAATSSVYPPAARRFVHAHGDWLWTVIAVVAIAAGLVFLRWLLVQPRVDRLRRVRLDTADAAPPDDGGEPGRTRMPADALCDVVEDEIADLRGVRRVSATLTGHADTPELWLRVATAGDADVARVRRAIVDDVVRDARQALDRPDLPAHLHLVVTRHDTPRAAR